MSDTADLAYELMKRLHSEFGEFRKDMVAVKMRLGSVEQHIAVLTTDVARINAELDDMRSDIARTKVRLDLVDA